MSDTLSLEELHLAPPLRDAVERWLSEPRYADDRDALVGWVERALSGDDHARAEIVDAFSGTLPIGTAGRRGACGPGPNRMNLVVLRETAQGLADAIRDEGLPKSVAVVFDTRRDSQPFAHAVAAQLAANAMNVIVVDAPRPTPLLSHMVRARGCGAGVVISASHNPAGDNGIKVYGPDGAQLVGARSEALMRAISMAGQSALPAPTPDSARIVRLATEEELRGVDDPYLDFVRAQGVTPPGGPGGGDAALRTVFTPLHGVGHTSVMPVLRSRGFEVTMVEAQGPDGGEFGTVKSANPESPPSLDLARAQAESEGADLVIANDPDADRLGALARDGSGAFAFIDGNRLAVLMLDHVLREGEIPAHGWVLTTICTTPLVGALSREAGVEVVDDLLVGFKHHAGMMAEQPEKTCVFATEEAHGYLRGDDVHDKDGAVAALLLTEAAARSKAEGITLFDRLESVWQRLGYHAERTANIYAYGLAGAEAIARVMAAWRAEPPEAVGGFVVAKFVDRRTGQRTGSPTRDLPGNVLVFEFEPTAGIAARLVIRPSGTEPKAKIYALARTADGIDPTQAKSQEHRQEVDAAVDRLLADAQARAEEVMGPSES